MSVNIQMPDAETRPRMVARARAAVLSYVQQFPLYILFMMLVYGVFYAAEQPLLEKKVYDDMILDTDAPHEAWRLYSHSLLHLNVPHLVNNLVMFLFLGALLNAAHGNLRIAFLHTLGAVGGALGVGWELRALGPATHRLRVVGASGSIYCMLGTHVGNVVINWNELPFRALHAFVLFYLLASDALLYMFFYNKGVSYSAHAGGFALGLLLSPAVLKNIRVLKWEKTYRLASFGIGLLCFGASLANFLLLHPAN